MLRRNPASLSKCAEWNILVLLQSILCPPILPDACSHGTSPLPSLVSSPLQLAWSKISEGSAFFHSSLPLQRAGHPDAIGSPPLSPVIWKALPYDKAHLQALLCFPSFNTLQNCLAGTKEGTQSSFLPFFTVLQCLP